MTMTPEEKRIRAKERKLKAALLLALILFLRAQKAHSINASQRKALQALLLSHLATIHQGGSILAAETLGSPLAPALALTVTKVAQSMATRIIAQINHQADPSKTIAQQATPAAKAQSYQLSRTVETELHRAYNEAKIQIIRSHDPTAQVRWDATPDKRTCPVCMELDGNVYSVNQPLPEMPAHPHCRCIWQEV